MIDMEGHVYVRFGTCPACGRLMQSVRYFSGAEGKSTKLSPRQVTIGTKQYTQTTTSTEYSDIREHRAGFCEACDRAEFETKENNWPKPGKGFLICAIVCGVVMVVGAALLVMLLNDVIPSNLAAVPIICLVGGLFFMACALGEYIPKWRAYAKHKRGYRAPYVPKTEEQLSNIAKNLAKSYYSDGRTYWNLTEMKHMQMWNGNLNFH